MDSLIFRATLKLSWCSVLYWVKCRVGTLSTHSAFQGDHDAAELFSWFWSMVWVFELPDYLLCPLSSWHSCLHMLLPQRHAPVPEKYMHICTHADTHSLYYTDTHIPYIRHAHTLYTCMPHTHTHYTHTHKGHAHIHITHILSFILLSWRGGCFQPRVQGPEQNTYRVCWGRWADLVNPRWLMELRPRLSDTTAVSIQRVGCWELESGQICGSRGWRGRRVQKQETHTSLHCLSLPWLPTLISLYPLCAPCFPRS